MTFTYNDAGRSTSGVKATRKADCVVRAVALATGQPYAEVYACLLLGTQTQLHGRPTLAHGVDTDRLWFKNYMSNLGWRWVALMRIGTGCRHHLQEGQLPSGTLIVKVSRHFTCVIDGVVHDTFDCTRGGNRCVYGYWTNTKL